MWFEVVAAAQGGQGGDRQLLAVHLVDAALPQVRQGAMKVFLQNKTFDKNSKPLFCQIYLTPQ